MFPIYLKISLLDISMPISSLLIFIKQTGPHTVTKKIRMIYWVCCSSEPLRMFNKSGPLQLAESQMAHGANWKR